MGWISEALEGVQGFAPLYERQREVAERWEAARVAATAKEISQGDLEISGISPSGEIIYFRPAGGMAIAEYCTENGVRYSGFIVSAKDGWEIHSHSRGCGDEKGWKPGLSSEEYSELKKEARSWIRRLENEVASEERAALKAARKAAAREAEVAAVQTQEEKEEYIKPAPAKYNPFAEALKGLK